MSKMYKLYTEMQNQEKYIDFSIDKINIFCYNLIRETECQSYSKGFQVSTIMKHSFYIV